MLAHLATHRSTLSLRYSCGSSVYHPRSVAGLQVAPEASLHVPELPRSHRSPALPDCLHDPWSSYFRSSVVALPSSGVLHWGLLSSGLSVKLKATTIEWRLYGRSWVAWWQPRPCAHPAMLEASSRRHKHINTSSASWLRLTPRDIEFSSRDLAFAEPIEKQEVSEPLRTGRRPLRCTCVSTTRFLNDPRKRSTCSATISASPALLRLRHFSTSTL